MIHDPLLLDFLETLEAQPWVGTVYRHMFGDYSPFRENTSGARWNPRDVAAIYTSLDRETAIAEADYWLSAQPVKPRAKRTIYKLKLTLRKVLDLRRADHLTRLQLRKEELTGPHAACQRVGGAVAWLHHDGLLVPSARSEQSNLVVYPTERDPNLEFEILDEQLLQEAED